MFISASASEPEHMVRVTPKSPVLQKKRVYYKTLQDDSDSCKFPKLIFKIFQRTINLMLICIIYINNKHTSLYIHNN